MNHLGDITKINGAEIAPVDVIIGGSPCQDLSIAGARAGLAGARSGLFMEQIRIVKEMRNATNGTRPGSWYGKTSQEHSQATKAATSRQSSKKRSASSSRKPPVLMCLNADGRHGDSTATWEDDGAWRGECLTRNTGESPNVVAESRLSQILEEAPQEKYYLTARACQGILNRAERRGKELPPELKAALIMQSRMGTGGNQVPLTMRYRSFGDYEQSEHASTLKARNTPDNSDVACETRTFTNQSYGEYRESDIAGTCAQRDYKSARDLVLGKYVRRLTPLECERLQGFQDGWTDIGDWTDSKGKKRKTSDAARYKAIGNSIALPPWKWVLKRLCAEYERDATMGSLFDGIGGFPLIWEQLNGRGSCLWASEIEEFCIAVTKRRFEG